MSQKALIVLTSIVLMEKDATIEEENLDKLYSYLLFVAIFNAEKIYANLANWSVGTRPQTITTPLLCQIHKQTIYAVLLQNQL